MIDLVVFLVALVVISVLGLIAFVLIIERRLAVRVIAAFAGLITALTPLLVALATR